MLPLDSADDNLFRLKNRESKSGKSKRDINWNKDSFTSFDTE